MNKQEKEIRMNSGCSRVKCGNGIRIAHTKHGLKTAVVRKIKIFQLPSISCAIKRLPGKRNARWMQSEIDKTVPIKYGLLFFEVCCDSTDAAFFAALVGKSCYIELVLLAGGAICLPQYKADRVDFSHRDGKVFARVEMNCVEAIYPKP